MTDDVVAELDRWMADWPLARRRVMKRARDEIVALRSHVMREAEAIRDEALEAAAGLCECGYTCGSTASTLKAIAAAIRALKDK